MQTHVLRGGGGGLFGCLIVVCVCVEGGIACGGERGLVGVCMLAGFVCCRLGMEFVPALLARAANRALPTSCRPRSLCTAFAPASQVVGLVGYSAALVGVITVVGALRAHLMGH